MVCVVDLLHGVMAAEAAGQGGPTSRGDASRGMVGGDTKLRKPGDVVSGGGGACHVPALGAAGHCHVDGAGTFPGFRRTREGWFCQLERKL